MSILVLLAACAPAKDEAGSDVPTLGSTQCLSAIGEQVWIEGQTFTMGADDAYPEEGPAHPVELDGFWMDVHEVTNAQFRAFVDATGYVTVAERQPDPAMMPGAPPDLLKPGSVLFTPPGEGGTLTNWWSYVPGTSWRHPEGPDSDLTGKDHFPVVHIAYEDAAAYAGWKGRSLPTEAQFELAARSGRAGEIYAWGGDDLAPDGVHRANTWQGVFPVLDAGEDGHVGAAPVGCYDANDYGVYDLIGNVWEWTSDWYVPAHNPSDTTNPTGPAEEDSFDRQNAGFPVKVIKGGSFMCAPNYCMRYRPAARHAQDTGLGTGHIGFRTVSVMP